CQVILEKIDRRGIVDRLFADELLVKNCGHRRNILVAEADVGAHKHGLPGLNRLYADSILRKIGDRVASEDLLGERQWPACGGDRRNAHLALKPRYVKRKQ